MRIVLRHLATAAAILIAVFDTAPTRAEAVYVNPEFGLYVPIPEELHACEHPDLDFQEVVEHNHGTSIFLDPADSQSCSGVSTRHRRSLSFWASYNATYHTRTLKLFRRNNCEYEHGRCIAAPKGLSFPNSRSIAYRVNRSHGWIDIVVLTQAGHDDFGFPDDPQFAVNYLATLHTDRAHFAADLRLFRTHLEMLRLIRLEPNEDSLPPEEVHRIRHEHGLE
jgi:hypothetical protein